MLENIAFFIELLSLSVSFLFLYPVCMIEIVAVLAIYKVLITFSLWCCPNYFGILTFWLNHCLCKTNKWYFCFSMIVQACLVFVLFFLPLLNVSRSKLNFTSRIQVFHFFYQNNSLLGHPFPPNVTPVLTHLQRAQLLGGAQVSNSLLLLISIIGCSIFCMRSWTWNPKHAWNPECFANCMFKLNQIHYVSWPCPLFCPLFLFLSYMQLSSWRERCALRSTGIFTSAIQVLPLCICCLCLCHFLIREFRNSGTINKSVWVVEDLMLLLSLSTL